MARSGSFSHGRFYSYNPDLTDEFSQLVLQMLAKKREDRPRDFHQVLMKLRGMKIYKSEVAQKTSEE